MTVSTTVTTASSSTSRTNNPNPMVSTTTPLSEVKNNAGSSSSSFDKKTGKVSSKNNDDHQNPRSDVTKKGNEPKPNPKQQKYVPLDKIQYYVQTPYGRGLTLRTRIMTNDDGDDGDDDDDDDDQTNNSSAGGEKNIGNTKKKTRRMREIELLDWKSSSSSPEAALSSTSTTGSTITPPSGGKPALLHSCADFPSVLPQVGDTVLTQYGGKGVVQAIRTVGDEKDNNISSNSDSRIYQVRLIHWRLARRSLVTCYLNANALQVIRGPTKLYEMTTVWEKVDHATEKKANATALFANHQPQQALQLYAAAIEAVKYVQHSPQSDNYVRADLVALLITCSNNAATCALQVLATNDKNKRKTSPSKQKTAEKEVEIDGVVTYKQVISYAQNALNLITALERKQQQGNVNNNSKNGTQQQQQGDSKIRAILREAPHQWSDAKLFGQFIVKSWLLQAKAHWHLRDPQACSDACQAALQRIAQFVENSKNGESSNNSSSNAEIQQLRKAQKEVLQWQQKAKEQKRNQLQREKKRAQAMFGGSSSNENKRNGHTTTTTASSPKAATSKPQQENGEVITPTSNGSSITSPNPETTPTATKPPKRRVSFSKQLVSDVREIEHRDDVQEHQEEVPWYQDVDFLIGLSLVGGVAIASVVGTGMLLMGGRRSSR